MPENRNGEQSHNQRRSTEQNHSFDHTNESEETRSQSRHPRVMAYHYPQARRSCGRCQKVLD
jgi:hypothetical protein